MKGLKRTWLAALLVALTSVAAVWGQGNDCYSSMTNIRDRSSGGYCNSTPYKVNDWVITFQEYSAYYASYTETSEGWGDYYTVQVCYGPDPSAPWCDTCWPQFNYPFGYTTGSGNPYSGQWSQDVYDVYATTWTDTCNGQSYQRGTCNLGNYRWYGTWDTCWL